MAAFCLGLGMYEIKQSRPNQDAHALQMWPIAGTCIGRLWNYKEGFDMRKYNLFDKIIIANYEKYTYTEYGNISSPPVGYGAAFLVMFLAND